MQVHNLVQGSHQWHAYRRNHFNASDAPAMLSCSPYKTRDQLIAELATGIVPEVDAATQRIFDAGHRFEALARPLAEKIIGEELAPLVGSEGRYSASFDGLTLMEDTAFEHKTLNAELRAAMVEGCAGADLPKVYRVQMEQQCMVSGASRALFMASKWERVPEFPEDKPEGWRLLEDRHCWYTPDAALRDEIVAGWAQLEKEVAAWVPSTATAVAKPTAKLRDALPVLVFDAKGEITASNVDEFKAEVLERINNVNMTLVSDQDFADGEADAKWLRDVSAGMKEAIQRVRSGMTSVNEVLTKLEQLGKLAAERANDVEKQVKRQKDSIKQAEVHRGQRELRVHIAQLNAAMPASYMPSIPADFDGAVKNKRTLESTRGAVNDELARAKIAASEIANRIHANIKTLQASGLVVHDAAALVLKAPDDLAAIIGQRVAAEQARQEAERERIRQEETAKLQREAEAKARADAMAAAAAAPAPVVEQKQAPALTQQAQAAIDTVAAQSANVVPMRAAPAPAERTGTPTLKLGQIAERLGFSLPADFLKGLGFDVAARERGACLYHEADFPLILAALVRHIEGVQAKAAA